MSLVDLVFVRVGFSQKFDMIRVSCLQVKGGFKVKITKENYFTDREENETLFHGNIILIY